MSARDLSGDVEALKALVLAERARVGERDLLIAQRDGEIEAHKQSISKLEHLVQRYAKWLFGPRTEKRAYDAAAVAGQPWLPFADLLDAAQRVADQHGVHGSVTIEEPAKAAQPARGKRRSEFPEHLPRVRTTVEVPETDRICCQKPMGVELTKELERVEVAVVHEIARTKYCCRTCQMQVLTAPGPVRPFPKGLLGARWLSYSRSSAPATTCRTTGWRRSTRARGSRCHARSCAAR